MMIVTSIFLFSLFGSPLSVKAQSFTVGVAKGDFFYYEMYGHYASSNPEAVINVPPFERNNTDWVRVEITGVSGFIIKHVYTIHFKDGNETKVSSQTDLMSTSGWSNGFRGVPISPSNLNVDDTIPEDNLKVKETMIRFYPSGPRETNLATWNESLDHGYCYFDKQTGMLVELKRVHLYINSETGEIISKTDIVKMTNSSFWAKAGFAVILPPIMLAALTTVGVVSVRRSFAKKKMNRKKMLADYAHDGVIDGES